MSDEIQYRVGEPQLSGGVIFWPLIRDISFQESYVSAFPAGAGVKVKHSFSIVDFYKDKEEATKEAKKMNDGEGND